MPRTADFHEQGADACLPEAAGVVDDATALDAAVDMRDAHAPAGDATIGSFLRTRESPTSWLPRRPDDLDVVQGERQEAEILEQPTPRGQRVRGHLGHPLIVDAAGLGLTQKEHGECRVDQQHGFHGMVCFLAAITARLLSRILGALDAPFGAIVAKRGAAGADAGAAASGSDVLGSASVGLTRAAASASVIPRRVATSAKDRVGASPRARSATRSTTKRT
jgi:hypothetical protein